jgi:uncharacterized coiled-coil DUF342 family protein
VGTWDDTELEAAKAAFDRFQKALGTIQKEITALLEKERDGTVSDADRHRLDEIKERFVEVMLKIGEIGERLDSPAAPSNGAARHAKLRGAFGA